MVSDACGRNVGVSRSQSECQDLPGRDPNRCVYNRLVDHPIGVRNQVLSSAGFYFQLVSVQGLCYTSCFKLFACFTAVTLWVNSFVVFVGKCKKNMTSLKGIRCYYFLSFLRSVWGWGVQSHPARPETQTWHHHEVPTQTQDLAVQANVQRRKSWVSAALCW